MAKQYIITKENRVANSPWFVEGSNINYDLTQYIPIPLECTTIDENGNQRNIRFINGCNTIDKQEQIKLGYAADRKPTQIERDLCAFMGGIASVPDGYKALQEYFDSTPFFLQKTGPRPVNTRILYEVYDPEAIEDEILREEEMTQEARALVLKGDKSALVDLLKLANPGGIVDPNTTIRALKLAALDVASNNPDFVLKSFGKLKNDLTVLVAKAVDYGILNMDTTGQVRLQRRDDANQYSVITKVPDAGGVAGKIERTVAFLEDRSNSAYVRELRSLVARKEGELFDEEEDDDLGDGGGYKGTFENKGDGSTAIPNGDFGDLPAARRGRKPKPEQVSLPAGVGGKKNDGGLSDFQQGAGLLDDENDKPENS